MATPPAGSTHQAPRTRAATTAVTMDAVFDHTSFRWSSASAASVSAPRAPAADAAAPAARHRAYRPAFSAVPTDRTTYRLRVWGRGGAGEEGKGGGSRGGGERERATAAPWAHVQPRPAAPRASHKVRDGVLHHLDGRHWGARARASAGTAGGAGSLARPLCARAPRNWT